MNHVKTASTAATIAGENDVSSSGTLAGTLSTAVTSLAGIAIRSSNRVYLVGTIGEDGVYVHSKVGKATPHSLYGVDPVSGGWCHHRVGGVDGRDGLIGRNRWRIDDDVVEFGRCAFDERFERFGGVRRLRACEPFEGCVCRTESELSGGFDQMVEERIVELPLPRLAVQ
jgi:hypothetical protein